MRNFISWLFLIVCMATNTVAQVTGGESIYQFMRLSTSAHITGMSGMCVSNPANDVATVLCNPGLLRAEMNNQLLVNQNFFLSGTSFTNIAYAKYYPKLKTTFCGSISYINHGNLTATDFTGQVQGNLKAVEYAMQVSASRNYLNKWHYGTTLKLVNSQLASFNSAGLMADAGLVYYDTANQFYFGMAAKNIGFQLSKYSNQSGSEPLPFDFQMGVSKKFLKAPFRLNAIVHHLYQWNIRYDNPADKVDNSFLGTVDTSTNGYFADKLFRHFNFGVDLLLGKHIEINVGYSHQHRSELALKDKLGMAGFSFGLGVLLPKMQVHYARNIYSIAGAYNEVGLTMNMKQLFGIGKTYSDNLKW